jgi:hypothetical protein
VLLANVHPTGEIRWVVSKWENASGMRDCDAGAVAYFGLRR